MYSSDPQKAVLIIKKHSITFSQAWKVFIHKSTKRKFFDMKHTTIIESRYYALGKLKSHGVIRIDYCIRDGHIRIIDAFKAGEEDRERYYCGEEDF